MVPLPAVVLSSASINTSITPASGNKKQWRKGPVVLRPLCQVLPQIIEPETPFVGSTASETCASTSTDERHLLWNLVRICCLHNGRIRVAPHGVCSEFVQLLRTQYSSYGNDNIQGDEEVLLQTNGLERYINRLQLKHKQHDMAIALSTLFSHETPHGRTCEAIRRYRDGDGVSRLPLSFTLLSMACRDYKPDITSFIHTQNRSNMSDLDQSRKNWIGMLYVILAYTTHLPGWDVLVRTLGDVLLKHQCDISAAHLCYAIAGCKLGDANRLDGNLLSWPRRSSSKDYVLDNERWMQAYRVTEAWEYAKRHYGNPRCSLPALQDVKLNYVAQLCAVGLIVEAKSQLVGLVSCLENGPYGDDNDESGTDIRARTRVWADRLGVYMKEDECSVLRKFCTIKMKGKEVKNEGMTTKIMDTLRPAKLKIEEDTVVSRAMHAMTPTPCTPPVSMVTNTLRPPKQLINARNGDGSRSNGSHSKEENITSKVGNNAFITPTPTPKKLDTASTVKTSQVVLETPPLPPKQITTPAKVAVKKEEDVIEKPLRSKASPDKMENSSSNTKTPIVSKSKETAPSSVTSSAPSSASKMLGEIRSFFTKKLNPNATEADVGESMQAYFDKKANRWVFPGEDPVELSKPLAPPPTVMKSNKSKGEKEEEHNVLENEGKPKKVAPVDPLAALIAPPPATSRRPRNHRKPMRASSAPVGNSKSSSSPPKFAMFTPPPTTSAAIEG